MLRKALMIESSAGNMTWSRAALNINACEVLLMSSEVHAK